VSGVWASRAVTATGVRERVRIVIGGGGRIERLEDGVEPNADDEAFEDATLLPGLVDLQVNGAEGVAYTAEDPDERARATAYHVRRGTTSLLATLVSAPLDALEPAIARLAGDVDEAGPVVGLHVEGPFLSEDKAGAHAPGVLCDPTPERVKRVLEPANGTLRMFTLAPERPGALEAIPLLVREGAVVAAGHSLASHDQMRRAIEAGLTFVTHVGNASEWPSRPFDEALGYRRSEPGLVGSFLIEERLGGSLILDGRHLHPDLARALIELRGSTRVVLVSDATPMAGLEPGHYRMGSVEAEVRDGYAVAAGGGLAGSVITLLDAVRIAVEQAHVPMADAVAMASSGPAQVIGIAPRKGTLRAGGDADLLLVGSDWAVRRVYRAGVPVAAS
jgi:N-acetylglucosamine-6-phosphate deacetylase